MCLRWCGSQKGRPQASGQGQGTNQRRLSGCQSGGGLGRPLIQTRTHGAQLCRSCVSRAHEPPVLYSLILQPTHMGKGPSNGSLLPAQSKRFLCLDFEMCPLKLKLAKCQDVPGSLRCWTVPIKLALQFNAS